jgi:hypothetical protein
MRLGDDDSDYYRGTMRPPDDELAAISGDTEVAP